MTRAHQKSNLFLENKSPKFGDEYLLCSHRNLTEKAILQTVIEQFQLLITIFKLQEEMILNGIDRKPMVDLYLPQKQALLQRGRSNAEQNVKLSQYKKHPFHDKNYAAPLF